jgi:hypothetical protein
LTRLFVCSLSGHLLYTRGVESKLRLGVHSRLVGKKMNSEKLLVVARVKSLLRHLGQVRDGLLVLGGILYIAGYSSWAFFASTNGLGPLPALQPQYFVSGVPVIVFMMVAAFSIRIGHIAYARQWPAWISSKSTKVRRVVLAIIVSLAMILFGLYLKLLFGLKDADGPISDWKVLGIIAVGFCGLALVPLVRIESLIRLTSFYSKFIYAMVVLLSIFFTMLYLKELHPLIPFEMGGPRPRAAILDLVRGKLSEDTALRLIPKENINKAQIIASRRVWIYFSSSSTVMLSAMDPMHSHSPELLELDRSAIVAIRWLREQRAEPRLFAQPDASSGQPASPSAR